MIRVSVPIDLNAVVSNASAAFALATPLRLSDIVATAVIVSLGRRAPQDKREREVRRTLDGLHAVNYEELVRNPSRAGAAMTAACGLPWQESALEIQRNAAVSLTASAAQVRRPIYGTSSGRWRHYERHLGQLIEGLPLE